MTDNWHKTLEHLVWVRIGWLSVNLRRQSARIKELVLED